MRQVREVLLGTVSIPRLPSRFQSPHAADFHGSKDGFETIRQSFSYDDSSSSMGIRRFDKRHAPRVLSV